MEKLSVILFSTFILIASMSNAVVFFAFKINQKVIAETFCINRDKPSLHCDGKCYLKSRLAESNDRQNHSSPVKQLEETLRITFFLQLSDTLLLNRPKEKYLPNFKYNGLSSQSCPSELMQPPENQHFTC